MNFLLMGIILLVVVATILSWSNRLPPHQRQLFMIGAGVLAIISLMRGVLLLAFFFGLLALGNWLVLDQLPITLPNALRRRQSPRTKLPGGCPPNCSEVDLSGAELRGLSLPATDFTGANLRGANLSRANLRRADLRGANLKQANLRGADLRQAILEWSNLQGARYDQRTKWPQDFDPSQVGAFFEE